MSGSVLKSLLAVAVTASALAVEAVTPFEDGKGLFNRRLGMFVHWGIYAVDGYHEQQRWRQRMGREEYARRVAGFTAERFSADDLVHAAESVGAEYIVFTAKHHDGFCMWDTKETDFKVTKSPCGRDVLKEISDACRRRGMKLGLYYSNPDWNHPHAYNPRCKTHQTPPEPGDEPDMDKYVRFVKAQITELMSNYGEICCLFWDIPTNIDRPELNELVRRLQPGILIDNRGWGKGGDYKTPERDYAADVSSAFDGNVEACNSVGRQSWGYRIGEDYHSVGYLTRSIDRYLSRGGNFLLNVGPKADGTLSAEAVRLLADVGRWYAKVRDSYRDVQTVPGAVEDPSCIVTRRGETLFFHFCKGLDATGVDLKPIATDPSSVVLLNTGCALPHQVEVLPRNWKDNVRSLHVWDIPVDALSNESIVIRATGLAEESRDRVVREPGFPTVRTTVEPGRAVFDFGRDAFGWLELNVPEGVVGSYEVRLGERLLPNGRVDLAPGGTIRSACVTGVVTKAGWVRVPLAADVRNTRGVNDETANQLVKLPADQGVVLPFRYVEVVKAPFAVSTADVRRIGLHWAVDTSTSSFSCSDTGLNDVYDLCKHTIVATSFAGVYVDGDRERIPYEADAYINQLGHYVIDPDFRMARATFRRLVAHPTWPTEWKQHMIMLAWTDWMWSGSDVLARESYELLKREKLLLELAREDGLIVTGGTRHPRPARGNDIVDWPICERDGFDSRPVNAVLNAFHFMNLRQMADLAAALGKREDAVFFTHRAEQVRGAFNRVFFDRTRGVYADGEGSSHVSLHANAAALAFGLVPKEVASGVADILEQKGMACSVYFSQYLLEALFAAGRDEAAIRLMAASGNRSWRGMLEQGSTMTMEAWNMDVKPNLDWNHAWGTPPLNVLARFVLGVTPLNPGFSKIAINPRVGTLKCVKGVVPTVRGKVAVEVCDGILQVSVPAPAVVTWKGRVYEIAKGNHRF